MNLKNNKALAGIDMIIAIVAIAIFSTLMFSLMYSNAMENVKLKQENIAMIYITEIFEKIADMNYTDIPIGTYNTDTLPTGLEIQGFEKENLSVDMVVSRPFTEQQYDDIIKKIKVTITYQVGNKKHSCSMERLKIKE